MDLYRCKKTYYNPYTLKSVYLEGEMYDGYIEEKTGVYYVSNIRRGSGVMPMYPFNYSEFKKHFQTLQEIRELEIDKILNI